MLIDVIWRRSQPSAVLVILSYYLSRIHKRKIVDQTRFNKIMHHIPKDKEKDNVPRKTTWSPKMEMWKMIFPSKWVIFRFHLWFFGGDPRIMINFTGGFNYPMRQHDLHNLRRCFQLIFKFPRLRRGRNLGSVVPQISPAFRWGVDS